MNEPSLPRGEHGPPPEGQREKEKTEPKLILTTMPKQACEEEEMHLILLLLKALWSVRVIGVVGDDTSLVGEDRLARKTTRGQSRTAVAGVGAVSTIFLP